MKKATQKKKQVRLTPEQKKERAKKRAEARIHANFKKKYKSIFKMASFCMIDSENKHFDIGKKKAEVDGVFIFKNIIVICEETTSSSGHIKEHIIKKKETATEILDNKEQFLSFLTSEFPQETNDLSNYEISELKFKFVYFSLNETNLSIEDKQRFLPWNIVEPNILSYLSQCSSGIKKSVKYEVFRFLGVTDSDFEITSSTGQGTKDVKVSIIYPQKSTGRKDGVRLVSFMLSADTLIRNSYVLRKDNWEDSIDLYQRLIDLNKIKDIRNFLYQKGECFYNNIIVALPDGIKFTDNNGNPISLEDMVSFQNCTMHIPNKMNSICVIDGQHRIFAHYEGEESDPTETKIAKLRQQLHLLVTGLIFHNNMQQSERI
ncbi:MAG: DGQHR domain-containing protein, partial [Paludibacteraceae bacterium]|nr:DGQHR domain-containing protein [Paludibacteraceae bacterium]